jgi:hypothetical protein
MVNAAQKIAAAEYFGDRGGIIVLDDCGWRKQINQNIACDRFSELRNVKVFVIANRAGNHYKP